MTSRYSGLRVHVIEVVGVDIMHPTFVYVVPTDEMVVVKSGTQFEGPCVDVDALVP